MLKPWNSVAKEAENFGRTIKAPPTLAWASEGVQNGFELEPAGFAGPDDMASLSIRKQCMSS